MKDLLKKLSRDELLELYVKHYPDDNNINRLNAPTLVARLMKAKLDDSDMKLLKSTQEQELIDEVEEKKDFFKQEVQKPQVDIKSMLPYDEDKGRLLTTHEIEQKAQTADAITLRNLVAKEKKKALETVIVEITPTDKRDIAAGKNCEIFITGNQYFTVTCAVPFGVPTEVPRCIAQVINETYSTRYVTLSEEEQKRRSFHPTTLAQRTKKFNLSVYSVEDFNKRRDILQ